MRATRFRILLMLVMMAMSPALFAQSGTSAGIIVGEPTGLSLKHWVAPTRAVDAAVAWSFSGRNSLHLHADHLWHNFEALEPNELAGRFPVYVGLGARVRFHERRRTRRRSDDDVQVGIRFPLGLEYHFAEAPVEIFGELVPILNVVPDSDFDLNAAVGIRYRFR